MVSLNSILALAAFFSLAVASPKPQATTTPQTTAAGPTATPQTTNAGPTTSINTNPTTTEAPVTGPPDLNFSELPIVCTTSTAVATNAKRQDTTATANPPQTIFPVPSSVIPSPDAAATLVNHLRAWVNSGYAANDDKTAAVSAARSYLRITSVGDGDGVFYAGADGGDAANSAFQIQQGHITVGIAFYGYGQFPFDYCIEPAKSIIAADSDAGNRQLLDAWFRITSIAFAQICSGTVWLVSNDANWRNSLGSGGASSIFVTDEADTLAANDAVTKIYQASTGAAYLWQDETEPALKIVANDALPEDTDWNNGVLLAYLIYDSANGGFQS